MKTTSQAQLTDIICPNSHFMDDMKRIHHQVNLKNRSKTPYRRRSVLKSVRRGSFWSFLDPFLGGSGQGSVIT
jgi:hypothetical protein